MEILSFIILRIVLAWMFLYPLAGLIKDWDGTLGLTGLVSNIATKYLAVLMVLVMFIGGVSILFGIYAQLGAAMLFIYTLIGIKVHYKLSQKIARFNLSNLASKEDCNIISETKQLGIVGHITSAQKNVVIAGALLFITLMGSGPYSITDNLF